MNRITALVASAMLAACGSASIAERDAAAQPTATAKPLTVAGLRIGMSATEARATLARDGWSMETEPGEDWTATVDHEAKRQRGVFPIEEPRNGVAALNAGKGDEKLVVEFQPTPRGDAVKLVKYVAPAAGRSPQRIAAEMTERYGEPGTSSVTSPVYEASWCTGGDPCRRIWGNEHAGLEAKLDVYGKLNVSLSQGVVAERSWQAAVKRAAVGPAPAPSSL